MAGLQEKISDNTRWGSDGKPSRLDYLLTSDPLLVENVQVQTPLGSSDHATVMFDLVISEELSWEGPRPYLCYNKANYEGMNKSLSTASWPVDWCSLSIDQHWELVKDIIKAAVSQNVPLAVTTRKRTSWLKRGTERLLKAKRRAWHTWRLSREQDDHDAYMTLRNRSNIRVRGDRRSFQSNLAKRLEVNPKNLYRFMAKRKSTSQGACVIKGPNGENLSGQEIAEMLSTTFDTQLNIPSRKCAYQLHEQPQRYPMLLSYTKYR
ncbi:unnamed protein product [Heterobilharzia americana]|nr:unnamed protein product [Heterobilharzia americana]